MKKFFALAALVSVVVFSGCQKTGFLTRYGIFHVNKDQPTEIYMNGTIGSRTEKHFDRLIEKYPDVSIIHLGNCPGSRNDEVNLKVAKKIYDAGIDTHVSSDSEIASGAVDLFLAGNKRQIDTGAMIGVHSWSDGKNEGGDLPVGHEEHQPYIDYYVSVGMTLEEATDFYFFTVNAAKASDIHWMTEAEIEQYGMRKE